ncbi:MAG: GNAT family N-acetyltransferase [Desulfovibrio sp.]|nr:GNAT family N-acetyltransferase [Desulfovibrio sp.]
MNELSFRLASPEDASLLAKIVITVSGGVVEALLDGLLPAVSGEQVLTMVLRDASSHYSYKNCVLAEQGGEIVGLLFAYPASFQKIPPLMKTMIPAKRLQPLIDILTAHVEHSLHINTFWVDAQLRGSGLSDSLMEYAGDLARDMNLSKIGLFAWRDNARALAFYARHGFTCVREVDIPPTFSEQHGHGDLYACDLSGS